MTDRSLRLGQAVQNGAVRPKAAESDDAAAVGGELAVREAGAGATACLNVVAVAGEYRRPARAVVRGVFQEEARPGEGLAVLILFLDFQRSRPAEIVSFLGDGYAVLGDRERVHRIVQLVALRRAKLLILIAAVEQAFKAQLAVCVGVALRDLMAAAVKESEACAGKRGVLVGVALDNFEVAPDWGVRHADLHGLAVLGDFHGDRGRVQYEALPCGGFLQRVAAKQEAAEGQRSVLRSVALGHKVSTAVLELEMYAGHGLASFLVDFEDRHISAGKLVFCGHAYCLPALGDRYGIERRIKHKMAQRLRLGVVVFSKRKVVKDELSVAVRLAAFDHVPVAVVKDKTHAGNSVSVLVHLVQFDVAGADRGFRRPHGHACVNERTLHIYGAGDYALLAVGGRRIEKQHRLGAVVDAGGIERIRLFLVFLWDRDMQCVAAAAGIARDARPRRKRRSVQRVASGQPGEGHFYVALKAVILLVGFQRQIRVGEADGMIRVRVSAVFQKLQAPGKQSLVSGLCAGLPYSRSSRHQANRASYPGFARALLVSCR